MPKFQLLSGRFSHEGVDYRANDPKKNTIETDLELDVLFANKFRRLGGRPRVQRDHTDEPDQSGVVMDKPLAEQVEIEEEMGDVSGPERKKPARPSEANTDQGARKRGKGGTKQGEESMDGEGDEPAETMGDEEAETEDVTEQFPKATDGGFKVSKSEKGYAVAGPDGSPMRKKPFGTKKEVNEFLKKHSSK